MHLRHGILITSIVATVTSVIACASSAGNHDSASTRGGPNGSGANGSGADGSGANGGASGTDEPTFGNAGTTGQFVMRDSGTGAPQGVDAACGAAVLEPEAIQVDKTVEQKIDCTAEVPEPIAIYLMLDNSKSMDDDSKWTNAVAAINTFVKTDPAAGSAWTCTDEDGKTVAPPATLSKPPAGEISVALQYFHPKNVGSSPNECDGTGHGTPAVAMGALPGNGAKITASLAGTSPTGKTPTVGALTGGETFCESYEAANPGKKCAVVLVTDGQPNGCGLSSQCADGGSNDCVDPKSDSVLEPIARKAHDDPTHPVVTFTVGMSGVNAAGFDLLDKIAIAGGSDCTPGTAGHETCDVTSSGAKGLLDALDTIRKSVQVSKTTNQSVTTSSTVTTTLTCEWSIPKPTSGSFDKDLVNVKYTIAGASERLGNVSAEEDCARAGGGWYYDDVAAPKKILACPETCTVIQSAADVKVQVLVGCKTVPATIR